MSGLDQARFREVLGHFATGITIVTALEEGVPVGFSLPVLRRPLARSAHGHPGPGPQLDELAPHRQGGRLLREHPRRAPGGALPLLRRLGRRQVRGRRLVARHHGRRRSSTTRWPSSSAGWATSSTAATTSWSPATWWPWRSARAARCSSTGAASGATPPDTVRADARADPLHRHRRRRAGAPRRARRRARPLRRDLPPQLVPRPPRDDSGQPLGEAGRRRGRPALPPAPGRLLVRAARHGSASSCTTCASARAPTGPPRSSTSTATSTRASTSRPGSPTGSPR